jgi:hypothetical protein
MWDQKRKKYDIIKITEMEFSISAEVQEKVSSMYLRFVVVYGQAHDDRKNDFLTELAGICANNKIPTLIGGDFNILRFSSDKNKKFTVNRYTDLFNWIVNTYEV